MFFKIGLITIIGLAAKNAILIVEFALLAQQRGMALYEAVMEAARLRLRPILMTSFAFILGVLPLVFSSGAGANARRAIGTGVAGGMLSAAILGVMLAPVFYVTIRRLVGDKLEMNGNELESTAMNRRCVRSRNLPPWELHSHSESRISQEVFMKISLVAQSSCRGTRSPAAPAPCAKLNEPKLDYTEYAGEPVKSFYMKNLEAAGPRCRRTSWWSGRASTRPTSSG